MLCCNCQIYFLSPLIAAWGVAASRLPPTYILAGVEARITERSPPTQCQCCGADRDGPGLRALLCSHVILLSSMGVCHKILKLWIHLFPSVKTTDQRRCDLSSCTSSYKHYNLLIRHCYFHRKPQHWNYFYLAVPVVAFVKLLAIWNL